MIQAWARLRADDRLVAGDVWRPLGPAPILSIAGNNPNAGRVQAIAVDPRDLNTIYIGAHSGGVWKTTDGGRHWVPLTDSQCSSWITALAIDPVNPDIVYAGTGNGSGSGGCGLL